jgi:hypothetical protein
MEGLARWNLIRATLPNSRHFRHAGYGHSNRIRGVADPVRAGFAQSLPRPGGNITGFTNFEDPLGRKWLERLKQAAPAVVRVLVTYDPDRSQGLAMYAPSKTPRSRRLGSNPCCPGQR